MGSAFAATLIFFSFGAALLIAGDLVIGRYLLKLPPWKIDHGLEFLLDGFFALVCAFFLRPVFRAQQRYNECRKAGQPFADAALLQTCRNRIFNYPLVLIAATYLCWTINISVFYFMNRDTAPLGPVMAIGLITSVINAVLCYYATETLTRFYLIPHWFPDGKITVTRRLMRKPSLMQRFVDLFMVNAFLPAISDNQGFVDKFIGDAVMAVFDAEFCSQRHRAFAFNAVSQILQGMRETNRQMQNLGLPKIDIGLGMACGEVIRGNIGAPERKELTVIGDTVNLAARLESLTKSVGRTVVASRNSIDLDLSAWPGIELSSVEPIPVRGKAQPVDVVAFSLAGEAAVQT
ncbi:MAG: hypothetical protein OHK0011_19540 [Turneriella sp.]